MTSRSSAERGERVQKILARAGIASRRKSEELIRAGRVTVNGTPAELGARVLPGDSLKVDGRRVVVREQRRYYLVNKPRGMVTTVSDPEGRPTVLELLPEQLRRGLFPVGRLDFQTEGLLLLTDDGDLAQRVAHPRFGCHKLYEVKVKGVPEATVVDRLRTGVTIDGQRTAPCRIERVRSNHRGRRPSSSNSWWQVELGEGRTRQIREMFHRAGHPVQRLRRVAIGQLSDPSLRLGQFRELEPEELELLQPSEGGGPPKRRRSGSAAGGRRRRPRR